MSIDADCFGPSLEDWCVKLVSRLWILVCEVFCGDLGKRDIVYQLERYL
jgi:hypothetical protein